MNDKLGFQALLEGFFLQWLIAGRGVSQRTIESYRDAFMLLLGWFGAERGIKADSLTMDDITMDNIESFLVYLDTGRGNIPKTVNCRLATIRSFCRYVSYKDPLRLHEMSKILSIPQRTETQVELSYLTATEVRWLVDACDKTRPQGRETQLLMKLLYNSGARISEALALKAADITFDDDGSCRVLFFGKGRKERILPLWPETAMALKAHIEEHRIPEDGYLFSGRNVKRLTRSGARSRIEAAVVRATLKHPSLAKKRISPHTFRHGTAAAMLASGIDISTIAIWLGHEVIQTTHRYVVADMKKKEAAISKVHPNWGNAPFERYKADPKALRFLRTL
jgi:site-specific recombinase XerD